MIEGIGYLTVMLAIVFGLRYAISRVAHTKREWQKRNIERANPDWSENVLRINSARKFGAVTEGNTEYYHYAYPHEDYRQPLQADDIRQIKSVIQECLNVFKSNEIAAALRNGGLSASGNKYDRISRLIENYPGIHLYQLFWLFDEDAIRRTCVRLDFTAQGKQMMCEMLEIWVKQSYITNELGRNGITLQRDNLNESS